MNEAPNNQPDEASPPDETQPDISKQPETIEAAAAADEIVNVWDAEVQITDDITQGDPAQAETIVEPIDQDYVPKDEMHPHHAESAEELFDCTIIGGGPTGLYGAFYAGMREMSVKIIDSLGELGGQVSALYPEKFIYDVAGFPAVKGKDLIAGCIEQGLQFGPTVCLGEKVDHLEKHADGTFTLTTDGPGSMQKSHRTKTLIIAAGVGAFAPRKLPDAPELDALEGKSIFYFVKDLETFRDKKLLIVGGGDSAMDWAMGLEPLAENITLIHRRDKWRAHEDSVKKVLASSVDVRTFHEVKTVQSDGQGIQAVTIFNNKSKEEMTLDIDIIVMCLGFIANIGPIREWGLEIEAGGIKVDAGSMETNIPGIYGAGDIVRYNGKLGLIATGFGEAATAANYAKHHIDPESRVFPGHSSERDGH